MTFYILLIRPSSCDLKVPGSEHSTTHIWLLFCECKPSITVDGKLELESYSLCHWTSHSKVITYNPSQVICPSREDLGIDNSIQFLGGHGWSLLVVISFSHYGGNTWNMWLCVTWVEQGFLPANTDSVFVALGCAFAGIFPQRWPARLCAYWVLTSNNAVGYAGMGSVGYWLY